MTYREHLEKLLSDCIHKGKVYINALGRPEHPPAYIANIKTVWKQAESAYEDCLSLVKTGKVHPEDNVPELLRPSRKFAPRS